MDGIKISLSEKKQMILSIFEILADDFDRYRYSLSDAIGKMATIDSPLAMDLYRGLLDRYEEKNHLDDFFSSECLYEFQEAIGEEATYRFVLNDPMVKQRIFAESGNLDGIPLDMISFFVDHGDAEVVSDLLQLVWTNKFRKKTQKDDEILKNIILRERIAMKKAIGALLNIYVEELNDIETRNALNLRIQMLSGHKCYQGTNRS